MKQTQVRVTMIQGYRIRDVLRILVAVARLNARLRRATPEEQDRIMAAITADPRVTEVRSSPEPAPEHPALTALRAVFQDMDSTGRSGDEWAYEWIHEVWPALVPQDVRIAVGDENAVEER